MTYAECGLDNCEARPYRPEVGDRIRPVLGNPHNDHVPPVEHLVTAVGDYTFLALENCEGPENQYRLTSDQRWVKVPDPVVYPERWMNVWGHAVGYPADSRQQADADHENHHHAIARLGVIHLASDGTLTMEAP